MSSRSDASVPRLLAEIVASYSPKAVAVSQEKSIGLDSCCGGADKNLRTV